MRSMEEVGLLVGMWEGLLVGLWVVLREALEVVAAASASVTMAVSVATIPLVYRMQVSAPFPWTFERLEGGREGVREERKTEKTDHQRLFYCPLFLVCLVTSQGIFKKTNPVTLIYFYKTFRMTLKTQSLRVVSFISCFTKINPTFPPCRQSGTTDINIIVLFHHNAVQYGVVINLNPELSILWYLTVPMKFLGRLCQCGIFRVCSTFNSIFSCTFLLEKT